jgi:predicted O-linked N-acetylglucosamine transferase (SPINDLY family)
LIEELHKKDVQRNPFDFTGRFDGLDRLRVGYVSPDFRRHSVGWFFREIIHRHDHENFRIYCYSIIDRSDDLTKEIRAKSFQFRQVGHLNDVRFAGQIFEDRIQILVDLAGYTANNRLDIFALRPAPVQITAFGYPHGTGLKTMDYRITAREAEGPDAEKEYGERLLFMPDHFLPFPVFSQAPGLLTKEDIGLRSDAVLMVSFNARHKLRPEVLRLWNRILLGAPNTFLAFSFRHSDADFARRQVLRHFTVEHRRILFLSQMPTEEQHRARYHMADLSLDPFPYNGTTTSWEALCMGVPVITLKGHRHVQRTT